MVRSLYSGVAGLTSHQTKMDVIGNNIANVNTYGFKSSRTSFSDVYYQSVKSATGGTETFAGNNPSTIGYGVQVASIDKDMSQSSFQSTNRKLDLAISGDGFFAVGTFTSQADGSAPADTTSPSALTYTRMGNFGIDSMGNLVANNNMFVLGTRNTDAGLVAIGDQSSLAMLQEQLTDTNGDSVVTSADYAYQNTINVNKLIQKAYNIYSGEKNGILYTYQTRNVDSTTGELTEEDPVLCDITGQPILSDPKDPTSVITYDEGATTEDAVAAGGIVGELSYSDLAAFDIGSNGNITVTYNNQLKVIGRIEVTVFDNPEGLIEAGETSYSETSASGAGKVKMPGDQGAGSLATNKLEMSNVNLAQEFSDMIVTQRGFQANARIITTSDSMLEELVNLKR